MIRRGNSGRGEGATDDSCRASRRKSIRGAGGVSTAEGLRRQCCFLRTGENVETGSFVFHGPPPGATGTPAMPAPRYRDIGIARNKAAPPTSRVLAISFIRKGASRPITAFRAAPPPAPLRESISPTKGPRRAKRATGRERRTRWSWCAASSDVEER